MQCPKCEFEQPDGNTECVACGVIFQKYRDSQERKAARPAKKKGPVVYEEGSAKDAPVTIWEYIRYLLFYVKPETNPLIVWARIGFFVVLVVWGLKFIFTPFQTGYAMQSFWHLINLPFHEAGHIFFRPFGRLVTSMGGSLGQLLMPLVCLVVFLVKTRDAFAASFSLWWLGESFMDLAPYIDDAKARVMPLLGGNTGRTAPYGFHDWEFILKETHLIKHYHGIACTAQSIGIALMALSFFWGGFVLYRQYRLLRLEQA